MWEGCRLFLEKLSLGSSSSCSNRSTRSLQTPKTGWLGLFDRLLRVFPLPQGRDLALISLRDFRALKQKHTALDGPSKRLHPPHLVHEMSPRDSFSEDVPYLSSSCRPLSSSTKDAVSTLSLFQKLAATIPRSQLTRPLPRHQPKALSFV
ncbi:hypothetical protein N431DRAFT_498181 [Stipitochalara longipes BDJ]|nr:hypothetical protein N431DRAFT_498181 [Stipitochalara longipes BDJ]